MRCSPANTRVVGEAHLVGIHVVTPGGERGEPLADLPRRILRRLAVQVGAGRRRRGRGVGHLLRVGGAAAHARQRHAQLVGDDLGHLGVQALAHLGAAVVDQDRAVDVHVHQSARLVEVRHVERDAELHRRQRDAALEHRAPGVEGGDLLTAPCVVAGLEQTVHQAVDDVVVDLLQVRRGVSIRRAVEVGASHLDRILAERACDLVENGFDRDRALRAAEAAESGVALRVGLRRVAVHRHVRQPVRVVEVAQRACHHRPRQVGREPGVADQVDLGAEHAAAVVEADRVVVFEPVAPAGDQKIVVAIGPQLHRHAEAPRGDRRGTREDRALRLLAAEAAAHAPAGHVHPMRIDAERVRHDVLHLGGMLRRAVHPHAAVLERHRVGDLPFEVELLLAADRQRALQPARRGGDRGLRVAAHDVHRRQHVLLLGVRVARRQHRRQRVDGNHFLGQCRRAARRIARARQHHEHRLAEVPHRAVGEDRIVVHDRAAVVAAGDRIGAERVDHAGQLAHGIEIDRLQAPVRHRRQAERGVQRAGELGHVVDVGRFAGHVQVGGLVRVRHAHTRRRHVRRHGVEQGGFPRLVHLMLQRAPTP